MTMDRPEGDEPEGFLARWSRLKREARDEAPPPLPAGEPDSAPAVAGDPTTDPATEPAADPAVRPAAEPAFDPASLPPIESLGAGSDYTAFLAPEVPQALRLQALRRAWVSDPVIANFRGFAEYDWDCNAPGYGALLPTDSVIDMVDNVLRKEEPEEEEAPADAETPVAGLAPDADPDADGSPSSLRGEEVARLPDEPGGQLPLSPPLSPEERGRAALSDVPPTSSASRTAQHSFPPSVDDA